MESVSPIEEYRRKADSCRVKRNALSRGRNYITVAKILVIVAVLWLIYLWADGGNGLFVIGVALAVAAFVLLDFYERRLLAKKEGFEILERILSWEADYLKGDFSHFRTGEEFADDAHAYARDLDIFGDKSLFQAMDRTVLPGSDGKLASWLKTPCTGRDEITARQRAAACLAGDMDWCFSFRASAMQHPLTSMDDDTVRQWVKTSPFFRHKACLAAVCCLNVVTVAALVSGFFVPGMHYVFTTLFLFQLSCVLFFTGRINRVHALLGRFFKGFGNYHYPLACLAGWKDRDKPAMLADACGTLFGGGNDAAEAFRRVKAILNALDNRGNWLVMILLNGLYCRDFHTMHRLDRWKDRYAALIPAWLDALTTVDVLVSMAGFRHNHAGYAVPVVDDSCILRAKDMSHPLVFYRENVGNDFSIDALHELFILTGANMSGKSTFLRTLGVNWVLAMTGNVVSAESFSFKPMPILTGMRTSDNLSAGTSYFKSEITRLKMIYDTVSASSGTLVVLDEILKGTNSTDKLNGSMRFLEKLFRLPVAGVVATHDLELGSLAGKHPDNFRNICFEIEQRGDDIVYDYKLKRGVSRNMNATFLLEKLGLI